MRAIPIILLAITLSACGRKPETLGYKIVETRPHDPECYTQGLEFHGKRLFESGGGYGVSTVREVDPADGKVLRKRPMAKNIFAEGITILNNELWVLSWKENIVTVMEPDTFKFLRSFNYKGEGWGLTNDGKQLIMSNGSSTIQFIDPKDFSVKRTIEVKRSGNPVSMTEEVWAAQIALNLNSAFLGCKHVLPVMERQFEATGQGGAIVNISSIGGLSFEVGGRVSAAYAASKAGLIAFGRSTAIAYVRKGIRVNTVVPGSMHTPLVEHRLVRQLGASDAEALIRRRHASVPMGRMGDAWDVAHAVLFLASDEARYITATQLVVDGGMTAARPAA